MNIVILIIIIFINNIIFILILNFIKFGVNNKSKSYSLSIKSLNIFKIMPKTNFQATVEPEVPQATEVANEVNDSVNTERNFKDIIKNLMNSGCQRFNDVTIKNVIIEEFDNYTRVTLVVKEGLPAYISDDNGVTYYEGKSNNVFTSTFALAGSMKEDEDLSWMANTINEHPSVLNLILNGSKVDIIVQKVAKGEEYVNPFTTKVNPEPTTFDNDTIIKYIVDIKLGKSGVRMADKLADKLMGF